MKDGMVVGVSVSLGMLLLAGLGVGGWYAYTHLHGSTGAVSAPATSSTAANAATAAAAAQAAAKLLADQQAKDAEWRRADKIQALQQQLDSVWNQIKINDTQIQTIEARPVPPGMYQQVKDELFATCLSHTAASWFFGGARCDSEVPETRIQSELKSRWIAQLSAESRPVRASNSELNNRQRELIANLAALGVTVAPVMVRGTA